MDDGVLADKKASVLQAVSIIETFCPSLGIFINLSKCEVFSQNDLHSAMKTSHLPYMVILGDPIGDYFFCENFIASMRLDAVALLSKLFEVATIDPQVVLILLRVCGSFFTWQEPLLHVWSLILCSFLITMSDSVLKIALDWTNLTPHSSRFSSVYAMVAGLQSLSHHSSAAFIASVCSSGFGERDNQYLVQTINHFNIQVLPSDAISVESVLSSPIK